MLRSIRVRLTLWYVLTLAVILTASGVFWLWYLERTTQTHLDERMTIIAADAASLIDNAWRLPDDTDLCEEVNELIHRHNWGELVQVRNKSGGLTCNANSKGQWEQLSLPKADLQQALRGHVLHRNLLLGKDLVRTLIYPAGKPAGFTAVVLVASRQDEVQAAITNLRLFLLTFSPLTLMLLSFGGWFLAGRTITPVVKISRSMQRISAESLDQRLPVSAAGDEISVLAEAINDLLARLQDSFRRIRQFSGDASHELRTPLTILKGETEVALRWAKTPEEFQNALSSNLEEVNRMERIIEDLLQLAKSDAGELKMEIHDLSLSDLVLEIYMQGRSLAEGRMFEVELQTEVDHEIRILGDELRLRQMFLNLIVNALKYTPDPGRVQLSLSLAGDQAVVKVVDNGVGIPEVQQAHIFDRFYRVDEARNREVGGAGLGLAIVKRLVTLHDGHIEVFSAVGEGSTFTVSLPLQGPKRS